MKLIVGLGNPGEKYAGNRHNIGFMSVDEIAAGYRFPPWKKRFQGLAAEGQVGAEKCVLLKPSTYMNDSGRAVGEAARFYKIAAGDVIVIHDELDLKPGVIRVKTGGGNAGHNGLKSISAHLGNEYVRVRLGIGHPGDKALVANYVLQDFAKADQDWLRKVIEGVAAAMARLVEGSEAVFLSDAVRSRSFTPGAAPETMNGASGTPSETPQKTHDSIVMDRASIAAITAAASRPIQPMEIKPLPVVAGREGGGGAVSKPVIVSDVHETAEMQAAQPREPIAAVAPSAKILPYPPTLANGPEAPAEAALASEMSAPPVSQPAAVRNGAAISSPEAEPKQSLPEQQYDANRSPSVANVEDVRDRVTAAIDSVSSNTPDEAPSASTDKGLGYKLKSWFHTRARGKPLA